MLNLGILGGTFDPPHLGHLVLAQAAYETLILDKIVLIPAKIQPHKTNKIMASAQSRYEMCKLAINDDPRFEISDMEIRRSGLSYTVDTLQELKSLRPDSKLTLVIGADNISDIADWKDPERIFSLCEVAAAARPNCRPEGAYVSRIKIFDMPMVEISSTQIRQRVMAGLSIKYLVPQSVEKYILHHGLYRE